MDRVDARIPLYAQTPQMQDPMQSYGNLLRLDQMMNQGQMQKQSIEQNRMILSQMNQDMRDQKRAREIIRESGGDIEKALPRLQAELGQKGNQIANSFINTNNERRKAKREILKAQREDFEYMQKEAKRLRGIEEDEARQAEWNRVRALFPPEVQEGLPVIIDDEFLEHAGDALQWEMDEIDRHNKRLEKKSEESGLPKGEETKLEAEKEWHEEERKSRERVAEEDRESRERIERERTERELKKQAAITEREKIRQGEINKRFQQKVKEYGYLKAVAAYSQAEIIAQKAPGYADLDPKKQAENINVVAESFLSGNFPTFEAETRERPFWPDATDIVAQPGKPVPGNPQQAGTPQPEVIRIKDPNGKIINAFQMYGRWYNADTGDPLEEKKTTKLY